MSGAFRAVTSTLAKPNNSSKLYVRPKDARRQAESLLIAAGFLFVRESEKSEARYFSFPGRAALIRIASHRKGKSGPRSDKGDGPTISSITFSDKEARDGFLRMSENYVEWQTATAIGLYMIAAPRE